MASIPTNAGAVVLNITAIGYGTKGWLSVYLNSQSVPATSTVNFDTSEYALANGTVMRVGTDGKVCVNVGSVNSTPGNSHVILDVTGYLTSTGLTSIPMLPSPQRVVGHSDVGRSPYHWCLTMLLHGGCGNSSGQRGSRHHQRHRGGVRGKGLAGAGTTPQHADRCAGPGPATFGHAHCRTG
jgi:hypothetical protein